MNSTLRPHQVSALAMLRQSLAGGCRRPMIQAPTGFGKTVIAAAIVDGALRKGNRVTFVVPALSLIDQTVQAFWAEGIREVGVIQGNHEMTHAGRRVQVASVQTLQRREIPPADIVLIDEAHRWFEFYGDWMGRPEWQRVPFVGLSATPWTKGLGRYFDDLIIAATTEDLIEAGFLAPFHVFAPAHPDLTGVRTVAGDYHEGDLADAMDKPSLTADVVETWRRMGEDRPTFVFAVSRAHAKHLQRQFEEAGIGCAYVDAYTDMDERESIRKRFHAGDVKVVCNVGCLTTGVDWDVRCIVLARPTKSEMLYCLDSETEILTSRGWKGMGEIRPGDCAATLADEQTGRGQWARVLGVVERDMDPSERWVAYSAPRANFRVTDQHTMIAAPSNGKVRAFRRMSAADLAALKGGAYMPTAVRMDQPGVPLTDDELYFVGMMMSDGTWTHTTGSITQSERHPEIVQRIEQCLRGCGIGYAKRRVKPSGGDVSERHARWRFDFSVGKPKAHARIGRGPNPTKTHAEHVPGVTGFRHLMPYLDKDMAPGLMALSRDQFAILLNGIWDGDGFKKKGVHYTPQSRTICTARKALADRLQALGAVNGYTVHLRVEKGTRTNPIYLLTVTPKDWRSCGGYAGEGRDPRPQIEVKPATAERVWCVETETGTIITRRRGKVTVMGNCQMIGRGLRTADGKADLRILDHSDTTLRLGFVTDILHDRLNDGRKPVSQSVVERKEPLPKECPSCSFLKPARVHECPSCGFAPERQSDVQTADGQLVELTGKRKKESAAERRNRVDQWVVKINFMAQLRAFAAERGRSSGWVAHAYRDYYGVWPNDSRLRECEPAKGISDEVRDWIRAKDIRFAKARKREAAA